MKSFIMLIFLVISCANNSPKEFEGLIRYSEKLSVKRTDLVDEKKLRVIRGDIHKLYYKNGSFKLESNGKPAKITIYRNTDSLSYSYSVGIDTLFANNIHQEKRSLDSLYFTGKSEMHLGKKTNELIQQVGKTAHSFYIDSTLYVNPKHYSKYKFGFFDAFYQKTKALYLKRTYESWVFRLEKVATKIEHKALHDSIFKIPNFPVLNLDLEKR